MGDTSNSVWLHRISHCYEVAKPLLDEGYITIGFSYLSDNQQFVDCMSSEDISQENKIRELLDLTEDLSRRRHCLCRFICMFAEGDLVVVPSWGSFSVYEIESGFVPAGRVKLDKELVDLSGKQITMVGNLLKRGEEIIDIGFAIKVRCIAENISRADYAEDKLVRRLKFRMTNTDMTDLRSAVEDAIKLHKQNRPIKFNAETENMMAKELREQIVEKLSDNKFEKLICWYLERIGADTSTVLSKNERNKPEGSDADVMAVFEDLKVIILVQAKHHIGTTSKWAVEQITKYVEAKGADSQEYHYLPWVISACDSYSEDAVDLARANNVRLIDGIEFSRMLINAGFKGLTI